MSDIRINMTFGYVKLDSWFERVGNTLIGMGSCTYSDGRKTTGPTGVRITGDTKTLDSLGYRQPSLTAALGDGD